MKKTIAVLMLGSALLLPNNTSVEASYSDNEVQVPSAQHEQCNVNDYKYSSNEVAPEKPGEVKPEQPGEVAEEQPSEFAPEVSGETPGEASISEIEKAVLDLTNAERQKAGLKPLQSDKNLMTSARQKSTDMATNNYFSHTSPTYGSPFDQMKANGITYKAAAENIAMGQRTAEEVVKGWMESPGHRENILTPGYTHIGIGFDKDGNYWTQQFIQK
ncbi:CAP domain-containing protein [Sporosarcina sp. NPDC096371]|uniref:CAP domain-containing protein n=1 Tax=Sporosarcina sp. NPDC096371 TaxID=3364530 RepID=UPI0038309B86